MILKSGPWGDNVKVSRRHTVFECGGSELYVFVNEDCFDTIRWLVRGDSWEDAYDNFLDDDRVADMLEVSADDLLPSEVGAVMRGEDLPGTSWNESGKLLYTETVMGWRYR